MVVSGIFLKGNAARLVTLTGSRKKHTMLAKRFNKLDLQKNPDKDIVEVFSQAFKAHCSDNTVDKVVVNKRATSGKGAGGAVSFIIEGIILAVSPVPVIFVHPATLLATDRKEHAAKAQRPATADLGKTYDLAYEGLE